MGNKTFNYWFILLISILLGYFGIDRFIIGDKKIGLIKLLTCGGCGILWLIDIILFATKANNNIEYTTSKNSKIIGISILVFLCFYGLIFNISKNYVKNNKKLASGTSTPIKSTPTKTLTLTLTPSITIKPTHTKTLTPEEIKKQKEAEEKLDKYIEESEKTIKPTIKPTPTKTNTSIVTLKQIYEISNNHVGNHWDKVVLINGTKLELNIPKNFNNSKLNAGVKITEIDSIPDIGIKNVLLKKGDNIFTVNVYENRGRYSGNCAIWKVIINVK